MSSERNDSTYSLFMKKSFKRYGRNKRVLALHEIKQGVSIISKKYQVSKVWLFGSYAHGNPDSKSDINLLVEYGDCQGLSCIGFMEDLEKYFQKTMDFVNKHSISKTLSEQIKKRTILIYDKLWNA